MLRYPLLLLLTAMILGAPVLCTAGVLLHPCDCGEEISCAHEDACVEDPCAEVLVSAIGMALDVPPADLGVLIRPPVGSTRVLLPTSPRVVNLPRPPSDLPLLN